MQVEKLVLTSEYRALIRPTLTPSCYVCAADMATIFRLPLLNKYDVQYFHCSECGYARTEDPYWLDEAYSDVIAQTDTGILRRNWELSAKLACTILLNFDRAGAYLDVAGGYGLMTRLMRDYGFDFYWQDKYCANLVARGFEAERAKKPFEALTCFEAIEHTINPVEFVAATMERYQCRNFIFSTLTYSRARPPEDWWYLSPVTGQHISFFQQRTLRRIAERLGLHFYSNAGLHIFSQHRLPRAWLMRSFKMPVATRLAHLGQLWLGSRMIKDNKDVTRRISGLK